MTKRKNILTITLLSLATFIFVAGCLPEPLAVRNIPAVDSKIVVSSQWIRDQGLVVLLTKSVGALEVSDDSDPAELIAQIAVNDAIAAIEGPDGIDTLNFLGSGAYTGAGLTFVAGQTYTLHVTSETLGSVSATTTAQGYVGFESVAAGLYYTGFDTLAEVNYAIKDPLGKNYYMLSAQHISGENLEESLINPRVHIQLLDDQHFEGLTYGERIRVLTRDFAPGDTLLVMLSNVNKDYYDFIKLRQDNRLSFVEFISEPINYPTNVEGGLGFFNLYNSDIRFFELEE